MHQKSKNLDNDSRKAIVSSVKHLNLSLSNENQHQQNSTSKRKPIDASNYDANSNLIYVKGDENTTDKSTLAHDIDKKFTTPDQQTNTTSYDPVDEKLSQILEGLTYLQRETKSIMISCQEHQLNLYRAEDIMNKAYGMSQHKEEEITQFVDVRRQFQVETHASVYYTKVVGSNSQYLIFQNRDDYKVYALETRNLRLFKIMNYGVKNDLKYAHEQDDRVYLVFQNTLVVVENKTFQLILKRQMEVEIMKLQQYGNNKHMIGISNDGQLVMIELRTLQIVYKITVASDTIYDIQKTSRRNEYAIYTHSDGIQFLSIIEFQDGRFNTVFQKEKVIHGSILAGVEIDSDVFLVKIGGQSNLSLIDRNNKTVRHRVIKNLNEHTNEFLIIPDYNPFTNPYILSRTNNALIIINTKSLSSRQILNLGTYQSFLGGALHLIAQPDKLLNTLNTFQRGKLTLTPASSVEDLHSQTTKSFTFKHDSLLLVSMSNLHLKQKSKNILNTIHKIEINKDIFMLIEEDGINQNYIRDSKMSSFNFNNTMMFSRKNSMLKHTLTQINNGSQYQGFNKKN
ncbi:UNKNOWN [Stylonychia lemnae]|uniref:Uncharacterized protein n=1 Tax=Stylonychia lemnae TaxID=5949 RepID=A0A078A7I9_STYLE|nr:UNKNOWN [Stylonychia lemnae]|eukprot:CDW77517.1 UNKNOWN [Stylonychia lemnae]